MQARLHEALLPLTDPPQAPGWNHAAVAEWLGDEPLVPAAVLVAIRDHGPSNVILTRRNDAMTQHAGQVAFPGGRMDAQDRGMVDTALREAEEEIGLTRDAVTPLGHLDCLETISGFCVTPVVGLVAHDAPALTANAEEVTDIFEVPLAYFFEPANMHRYTMDYRGQPRPMVEFRFHGHRIWGATAAMLYNLLQRMGET